MRQDSSLIRGLNSKKHDKDKAVYYVFDIGGNVLYEQENRDYLEYVYVLGKHFARVDGNLDNSTVKKYFYHTDHLGSTVLVTDEAGQTVWASEYTPFGGKHSTEGELTHAAKFTGKDLDEDIGLYYFNARWYDQEIGRFISEDPIQDGLNWYTYTANNPLKYIDPTGLWFYEADKEAGEIFATAEKGDTMSGLGKEVYGSGKAAVELGKINDIKDINKIKEGQRIRLEALEGFGNDKYSQKLKGSFLKGDLSYSDLVDNGVTGLDFNQKEEWFSKRYAQNVQRLYDEGKMDKQTYDAEIERLGGYVYDTAFGNVESRTTKITKNSFEVNTIDEAVFSDAISAKLIGNSFEHKWMINPEVKAKYEKGEISNKTSLKADVVNISLSAELYLYKFNGKTSIGPVELSGAVKYGIGGSGNFTVDEQGKPALKVSGALGFGYEFGIKVK